MGRPAHRASTAHLQALFPFVWEGGLGPTGAYIGPDIFGAPFYFDPIGMYGQPGLDLTDPNMLILGKIGKGKSALLKCLARRLSAFGYSTTYLDPKGETADLAAAFGVVPLRPVPGGDLCLNPFDGRSNQAGQDLLLRSLVSVVLGRPLAMAEQRAVTEAIQAAAAIRATAAPTLRVLQHALAQTGDAGREPYLALWNLVNGPAAGLFDGPTTGAADVEAPLVALDLSGLLDSVASEQLRTVTLAMAAAWLFGRAQRTARRRLFIVDEAWYLLRDRATAEWLQQRWKLARSLATANVAVLHRLSDLEAAGANAELARGLVADTQTRVIFNQPDTEAGLLQDWLGLSDTETECVLRLPRGWALWKVADRAAIVQLDVQASERGLIDTDHAMRGEAA